MSRNEIPREPSKVEVCFDATCRELLALGMTRTELAARMLAHLVRRERGPLA